MPVALLWTMCLLSGPLAVSVPEGESLVSCLEAEGCPSVCWEPSWGRDTVGSQCPLAQPCDLNLWLFNPLEMSLSSCVCVSCVCGGGWIRGWIGGPGVQPGLHPIQWVPPSYQRCPSPGVFQALGQGCVAIQTSSLQA